MYVGWRRYGFGAGLAAVRAQTHQRDFELGEVTLGDTMNDQLRRHPLTHNVA